MLDICSRAKVPCCENMKRKMCSICSLKGHTQPVSCKLTSWCWQPLPYHTLILAGILITPKCNGLCKATKYAQRCILSWLFVRSKADIAIAGSCQRHIDVPYGHILMMPTHDLGTSRKSNKIKCILDLYNSPMMMPMSSYQEASATISPIEQAAQGPTALPVMKRQKEGASSSFVRPILSFFHSSFQSRYTHKRLTSQDLSKQVQKLCSALWPRGEDRSFRHRSVVKLC